MIRLRFGGYQPARSVHSRGLRALADSVLRRAGGELAIELTADVVAAGHQAAGDGRCEISYLMENGLTGAARCNRRAGTKQRRLVRPVRPVPCG